MSQFIQKTTLAAKTSKFGLICVFFFWGCHNTLWTVFVAPAASVAAFFFAPRRGRARVYARSTRHQPKDHWLKRSTTLHWVLYLVKPWIKPAIKNTMELCTCSRFVLMSVV